MKLIRFLQNLILLALGLVILGLGYCVLQPGGGDSVYQALGSYRPESNSSEAAPTVVNQSILDLQGQYPDVLGWLTVDNTAIDYPFVQTTDNDTYLHADLDKNYLYAGAVFADAQNAPDCSDFVTVLYGHNMRDGSMFQNVTRFAGDTYFADHTTGTVYLPYGTYRMEIFAYLVVASNDDQIYTAGARSAEEIADFMEYVQGKARQYRETELAEGDHVIALSTCVYDFTGARGVLLAKLVDASGENASSADAASASAGILSENG